MISLEEQFEVEGLQRAILTTYAVSVPHLERAVIGRLLDAAEDESEILLLVDGDQHERAFVESGVGGISGPGINYRIHPVHLGATHRAFHPKVFVLKHSEGIRVLVGSANLTAFGCRRNVEVVETFDFRPGQVGAATAADLAEVLATLGRVASALPSAARKLLDSTVDDLVATAEQLGPGGPRILHSGTTSLWRQLNDQIGEQGLQRLVFITPYFDRKGAALKKIMATWPDADHTVITRPDAAGTLDGKQVDDWHQSPELQICRSLGGERRPLHAKALFLESKTETWVVSGSANMTASAWLRSAATGGNFEVVVVRRTEAGVVDDFLKPLGLERGHWSELHFMPNEEEESADGLTRPIQVGGAEYSKDGLAITLTAHSGPWADGDLEIEFVGQDVDRKNARVVAQDDDRIEVRCSTKGVSLGDQPCLIALESQANHEVWRGQTWISREDLLARPSRVKRISDLATSLLQTGSTHGDGLLTLLSIRPEPLRPSPEPSDTTQPTRDDAESEGLTPHSDRTLPADDLIDSGGSRTASIPGSPTPPAGRNQSLLAASRRLSQSLRGGSTTSERSIFEWDRDNEEALDGESDEYDLEPTERERRETARIAHQAAELLEEELATLSVQSPEPPDIQLLTYRAEHILQYGLKYELDQTREGFGDEAAPIRKALRATARTFFSLHVDGREGPRAHPDGWLVWAWARRKTHWHVRGLEDAGAQYGALLSAVLVVLVRLRQTVSRLDGSDRADSPTSLELNVLAGLSLVFGQENGLVPGEGTAAHQAYRTNLQGLLDRAPGLVAQKDVREVVTQYNSAEKPPTLVRVAKVLLPVLWRAAGERNATLPDPQDAPPSVSPLILDLRHGRDPRIGEVEITNHGTYCSCRIRLPSSIEQDLRSLAPPYVVDCPTGIHRLVPAVVRSPLVQRVVAEYWPELEDVWEENQG